MLPGRDLFGTPNLSHWDLDLLFDAMKPRKGKHRSGNQPRIATGNECAHNTVQGPYVKALYVRDTYQQADARRGRVWSPSTHWIASRPWQRCLLSDQKETRVRRRRSVCSLGMNACGGSHNHDAPAPNYSGCRGHLSWTVIL